MLKIKTLLSISVASLLLVACNNSYDNDTKIKVHKTHDNIRSASDHASYAARNTANAASAEVTATKAAITP